MDFNDNQGKLLSNIEYLDLWFVKSLPWPIEIHGAKISFYRNIFISQYLFIAISFYRNIFLLQYLFIAISFYCNIFLSQYLFIEISFYRNIVCQNVSCDVGLKKMINVECSNLLCMEIEFDEPKNTPVRHVGGSDVTGD